MNETIETLISRRSCKSYVEGKRVPNEILDLILKAGTYAPTGMGMQSPIIVVANDDETVKELSEINASVLGSDKDPFYGAPTVLVVLADSRRNTCVEDGSLVMGNLLNAAHALGVGACWIHRARESFKTERGKKLLEKWGIDENYVGIGNCVIGYPKNPPTPAKPRKPDYIVKV